MPAENKDRNAIVSHAIGIPSEEERATYLAQACGDDDELKHQVEEQVAAHLDNGSQGRREGPNGTSTPPPEQTGAGQAEDRDLRPPRIGPYKISKQIGEDPSGIVYEAEQEEPVRLPVALKVVKHGLDWPQIVSRFEAERHVLSRMEHPNLARLLGAGTRPSGQPYFVLELVEGSPLTKYCDEHKQSLQQRLQLFLTVCRAVQYAHQRGVIHGDLKPSNVLVSGQGDKPAAKILDFGVARAVRRKPSDNAPPAGPEVLGDKPEYLSPEQANPNDPDIDTRGDIYRLGVLLYELVTGTTPLTAERLKDVSMTETLRLVREEEAPSPSARLDESKDRLTSVAAKRQMKPDALLEAVRGDLDCVVVKALRKDRTRRYETVHELIRDIERYLAREPVEACRHGTWDQMRATARKHPRAVTAAVLLVLLLLAVALGSAGLAAWERHKEGQAKKAEQQAVQKQQKAEKDEKEYKDKYRNAEMAYKVTEKERDRARKEEKEAKEAENEKKAILTFFQDKLLSAGRPGDVSLSEAFWAGSQGKDVTVRKDITLRKAVDETEAQVSVAFGDRPLAEASIREMLGLAYLKLGAAPEAIQQYERAFGLRMAVQGPNDRATADVRNQLAVAYRLAGRTAKASDLYHHDPNSPSQAAALAARGEVLLSQKKLAEAEQKLRESLTIRRKIQPDDWTTYDTQSMLGQALLDQKKYEEAQPLLLGGYDGLKRHETKIPSRERIRLIKSLERLVLLYEGWGKKEDTVKWRKVLEAAKSAEKP